MAIDLTSVRGMPAELAESYRRQRYWTDDTLADVVERGLRQAAALPFSVRSAVRPWRGTLDDVDRGARRLAGALRRRGVGPGDVVLFQLPNWAEAAMTFWAAAYLGAVVVPVVHFYGAKEVAYVLDVTEPSVVITPDRFGRTDHLALYDALLAQRPKPQWFVVRSTATPLPGPSAAIGALSASVRMVCTRSPSRPGTSSATSAP